MTSLRKKLKKLLLFSLAVLLLLYIGSFAYFYFGSGNHYSKQQVAQLTASINKAPILTDSFYAIYDQLYANRHHHIINQYWSAAWTQFVTAEPPLRKNFQYAVAVEQEYQGQRYVLAPHTLAFRVDREVTAEKCFDYIMTSRYSDYCKEFKIKDTITNLKDRQQIISFLVANKQPRLYRVHPARFRREVDSVANLLASNL